MSLLTRMRVVISYKASKNLGSHTNMQEAVKVMKIMTHFLAFPILCGLTYMEAQTLVLEHIQAHIK